MPAVKSIPIRNQEGQVVGQRFEPSNSFLESVRGNGTPERPGNYVLMVRPDGKTVRVNRKLAARGNYADKGFTEPKRGKEQQA